jgi:hypothetical protein
MTNVTLPLWAVVAQWIVLLSLATLVIVMYRQMGYYLAVSEAGAENLGLDVGALAPAFDYAHAAPETRNGLRFDPLGRWSLLLFIDPACGGCERSLAALDVLRERGLPTESRTLVVTGADARQVASNVSLRDRQELALIAPDVVDHLYRIQKVPFAYVIDPSGRVRAKGTAETQDAWRRLISVAERPTVPLIPTPVMRSQSSESGTGG